MHTPDSYVVGSLCALCVDGSFASKLVWGPSIDSIPCSDCDTWQDPLVCKTCPNSILSASVAVISGMVVYTIGIMLGSKTKVDSPDAGCDDTESLSSMPQDLVDC